MVVCWGWLLQYSPIINASVSILIPPTFSFWVTMNFPILFFLYQLTDLVADLIRLAQAVWTLLKCLVVNVAVPFDILTGDKGHRLDKISKDCNTFFFFKRVALCITSDPFSTLFILISSIQSILLFPTIGFFTYFFPLFPERCEFFCFNFVCVWGRESFSVLYLL